MSWWIGVLFVVGSLCFALGAAPGYVDAVGVAADGVTFFVGSLFFTAAACLQYLEVTHDRRLPLTGEPHRIDWWAALVQVVGTVLFNISTLDAMREHLSDSQADRLVWTPDALGSICFLVAAGLAWAEVGRGLWSWRPRSLSWLIAAVNLGGSDLRWRPLLPCRRGAALVAAHAPEHPARSTLTWRRSRGSASQAGR